MLYKNLHRIQPKTLISITYKMHGTSGISSYVICKKHNSKFSKALAWLWNNLACPIENLFSKNKYNFELNDREYNYLYASRKVIKNEELNPTGEHFYDANIWEITHNELKEFLQKGMTFYYEVVGFMPSGAMIQKDYDYGCATGTHKIYIYRITYTNPDGKVFEFSAKQVQDFCHKNGLNPVTQLYYGSASEFSDERLTEEHWETKFLETIKEKFNEKDCYMCNNKVPEEGVVIRIEGPEFEAYKQKSTRFYERETKLLDQGVEDIESIN